MKIACIGGGGSYFVRPLTDFATTPELIGCEIALYDIDSDRAEAMAGYGRKISKEHNSRQKYKVSKNLREAVSSADFVLASIGGAGSSGVAGYYESPVHLGDNVICAEFGISQVIGDTCGPSAMMAAFRSVPIYINICRHIEKYAPDAIMLNHANPMAILCRAMNKYTEVKSIIGICHGVQGGVSIAADILGVPYKELETRWVGTNHYYWFTKMLHKGEDIQPLFWKTLKKMHRREKEQMCYELSHIFDHWIVYPEDDHIIEFFPFASQIKDGTDLPYNMSEHGYGKRMKSLYSGEESIADIKKADRIKNIPVSVRILKKRLEEMAVVDDTDINTISEGTGDLLGDIISGRRGLHICNIPNMGAIPNLPPEALVEVEAITDSQGVRPLYMDNAPPILEAQLRKRFLWHELVADAAVKGDKKIALQAMMVDECAIIPSSSKKLLDKLLKNSQGMLPTFK